MSFFSKPNLLTDPIGSCLTKLTVPMMFGILAIFFFQLADSYFIGKLGVGPLAAIGFIFPVTYIVLNVGIGLGIGTASVVSRLIGAGEPETARVVAGHSLALSTLAIVSIGLIGHATITPLFSAMGASAEVLSAIRAYMSVWFLSCGLLVIPMVGNSIIRATGDTTTPGLIMVLAALLNIGLDPLFIFGFDLGIRGAAWATVVAWVLILIMGLWVLLYRDRLVAWSWDPNTLFSNWKTVGQIALPASLTTMLQPIAGILLMGMISAFGPEAVAGIGVGFRLEPILLLVAISLSTTLPGLIGQNWGAKQLTRVATAIRYSQWFCIGFQLVVYAGVVLWATPIATLFSRDPVVIAATTWVLRILALTYGFEGVVMVTSTFFNTIHRPLSASGIAIVRLFGLMLPLAYWLQTIDGVRGIVIGMAIANIVSGLLSLWWTKRVIVVASQ